MLVAAYCTGYATPPGVGIEACGGGGVGLRAGAFGIGADGWEVYTDAAA